MQVLTGEVRNQVVQVGPGTVWRRVRMAGCTVAGGPSSSFSAIMGVQMVDCTFLYDGMEVDGYEWVHLMRRGDLFGQPLPPRAAAE